jgi:C1A family cysteine protease
LTPVKNQGSCGSCWAFSTVETLESREKILNNKDLQVLSPQQLVDCENAAHGGKDQGCQGGLMENAFDWLNNKGIALESDYPYTGTNGTCKDVK